MRFSTPTFLRTAVALGASAALAVGCSKEFYTGVPDVDRVEVEVAPRVINVNNGAVTFATPYNGSSAVSLSRAPVTYKSENPAVAIINPQNGGITGVAPGVAYITATARGKTGRDSVIVRLVPARSVVISGPGATPRSPRFRLGAINGVNAAAFDSANGGVGSGRVKYQSTNEAVLLINATTGIVTPRAVGTASIIASVDNGLGGGPSVADTVAATVTVPPIGTVQLTPAVTVTRQQGEAQQFTATLTDSLGAAVAGRPISWLSNNTSVVAVDANGLATALAPGSVTVSAVVERVPGEAGQVAAGVTFTVVQPPAARVDVAPASVTLRAGETRGIVLTVRDAAGNELFGRAVLATPADQNVVTAGINSDGVRNTGSVRGVAVGTSTVNFQVLGPGSQFQGTAGVVTVTVTP